MIALRVATIATAITLMLPLAWAGNQPIPGEKEKLDQARTLIANYYGDPSLLQRAATIVSEVLRKNPNSSAGYVEAARITIKGGHIVSDQFAPGTKDAYRFLVLKALELDPDNVKALSLRAEIYLFSGANVEAVKTIHRGLELAPGDPWLKLNLAEYYRAIGWSPQRGETLNSIMTPACDSDPDYRRACVVSLQAQISRFAHPENQELVRSLAKRLLELRNPRDAWALGGLSYHFAQADLLDQSIEYGRQALQVMDHGVARLNLAAALYAKAALLQKEGRPNDELLREADALGVPEERVLEWYHRNSESVQAHAPRVLQLFESRNVRRPVPPGEAPVRPKAKT